MSYSAKLTKAHMHILRHTLGINDHGTGYRNHFCAGEDHPEWDDLLFLEKEGWMRRVASPPDLEQQAIFYATNEGKELCKGIRT